MTYGLVPKLPLKWRNWKWYKCKNLEIPNKRPLVEAIMVEQIDQFIILRYGWQPDVRIADLCDVVI